jgi:NTP pyrophosphatase (non-canonical NTP hydrolase)
MIDELVETIELEVIQWAKERDIFNKATPSRQFDKTMEEVTELGVAINENDHIGIIDGIGDTMVTLAILAKMYNTNLFECFKYAYNEIKDRKGEMINGQFVKK